MSGKIIPLARRGQPTLVGEIVPAKPKPETPQPLRMVDANQCPLCKGDGWLRANKPLGDPMFGKVVKCACTLSEGALREIKEKQYRTYRWLGQSEELAAEMESVSFATFKPRYRHDGKAMDFTEAYQQSRGYADLVKAQAKGQKNVLYVGTYGAGKTHLAGSILNELRAVGVACLFTTAPGLFKALYAADFQAQQQIILDASTTPLFVLDDLDKLHVKQEANPEMKPGSYQKSVLFEIIDARYVAKLPTIITTNEENDLYRWLDKAVVSRLFSNVLGIQMVGCDYRQIARK